MNKYEIIEANGQSIIVYYQDNTEVTREVYSSSYIIRNGYKERNRMVLPQGHSIPFIEGDYLYDFYLDLLKDDTNLNEDGFLSTIGKYKFDKEIRKKYSEKISNIEGMSEAVERFAIDGTPVPQTIINQRDALKTEFFTITNTLY